MHGARVYKRARERASVVTSLRRYALSPLSYYGCRHTSLLLPHDADMLHDARYDGYTDARAYDDYVYEREERAILILRCFRLLPAVAAANISPPRRYFPLSLMPDTLSAADMPPA